MWGLGRQGASQSPGRRSMDTGSARSERAGDGGVAAAAGVTMNDLLIPPGLQGLLGPGLAMPRPMPSFEPGLEFLAEHDAMTIDRADAELPHAPGLVRERLGELRT